ncbi:MAG TPA: type II secretion system F family protein, partial [Verrucomicrobiae bacterium]
MKADSFSFFNRQLAALLREGMPLEGAVKHLAQELPDKVLRRELLALEADLSRGIPVASAIKDRQLPAVFKSMMALGVEGNNLPAVLDQLGDYYERESEWLGRLKILMIYPLLALLILFLVSLVLAGAWSWAIGPAFAEIFRQNSFCQINDATRLVLAIISNAWVFPVVTGIVLVMLLLLGLKSRWRYIFQSWIPIFKTARQSRIAEIIALLTRQGLPPAAVFELVAKGEPDVRFASDLKRWHSRLAAGYTGFADVAGPSKCFSPYFIWLVSNACPNWTTGFERAARVYSQRVKVHGRSAIRHLLPATIVFLTLVVLLQFFIWGTFYRSLFTFDYGYYGQAISPSGWMAWIGFDWLAILILISIPFVFLAFIGIPYFNKAVFNPAGAELLVELIGLAGENNSSLENTIIQMTGNQHNHASISFHLLAAQLETGMCLSQAIEKIPEFASARLGKLLRAGEKLGDYQLVLPACRMAVSPPRSSEMGRGGMHLIYMTTLIGMIGLAAGLIMSHLILPRLADVMGEQNLWWPSKLMVHHGFSMIEVMG